MLSLFFRVFGGDHRPALQRSLRDENARGKPADDAVSFGEMVAFRRRPRRIFGDDETVLLDLAPKLRVLGGIGHVKTASEHGDGLPSRGERTRSGGSVDPVRHPADHDRTAGCKVNGDIEGHPRGVIARRSGTDDTDGLGRRKQGAISRKEQDRRGFVDLPERLGIVFVKPRHDRNTAVGAERDDLFSFRQILAAQTADIPLVRAERVGDGFVVGVKDLVGRRKHLQEMGKRMGRRGQ